MPHSLFDRGGRAVSVMLAVFFLAPEMTWILFGPTLAPNVAPATQTQMLVGSALLALLLPLMQTSCRFVWWVAT